MIPLSGLPPLPAARAPREKEVFPLYSKRETLPTGETMSPSGALVTPVPQYALPLGKTRFKAVVAIRPMVTTESRFISQMDSDRTSFYDLLHQMLESRAEASEDDLAPTDHAMERAALLFFHTSAFLPKAGRLYRDGEGGLSVDWKHEGRQVRLLIHASQERENYIYWREGETYYIDTQVTPQRLSYWFQWLRGDAR